MANTLAQALRAARERVGKSQSALAQEIGLAPNHLARLESGEKVMPRFDTVARLATALGVSLDELAIDCGYRQRAKAAPADASEALRIAAHLRSLRRNVDAFGETVDSAIEQLERRAGRAPTKSRKR